MTKPPSRCEDIPKSLKVFDIPTVLLARHVLKYARNSRTTKKVLTIQANSLFVCDVGGAVSRYVPIASVRGVCYQSRHLLLKVTNDADVLLDVPEDKKNTSQDMTVVIKLLEGLCQTASGNPSFAAEDLSGAAQQLYNCANLKKGKNRPHPLQQLSSETKRVMTVTKVKYDAVEMELQGKVATTSDGAMVVLDGMAPAAAARQKAMESEINHLRQRLQESEQLRALQSQVDQMQRVLFEQSQASKAPQETSHEHHVFSRRPLLVKPRMPDYLPGGLGSLNAAKALTLQHHAFSFLANKDLWLNLVRVVAATTHVMAPPVFTLSASHSGDTLLVGTDFLRDFLLGWRQHNAHYIVVAYAKESESIEFYATREFWKFITRENDVLVLQRSQQMSGGRAEDLDAVVAQCDQSADVVRTTLSMWAELVERWALASEPLKRLTTMTTMNASQKEKGASVSVSPSPQRRLYL